MNILIANHKKEKAKKLTKYLRQYDKSVNVLAITVDIASTISFYTKKGPNVDLAFFETELSDGPSFEIFNSVSVQNPVIFTSFDTKDAYRALKANGLDYLPDPLRFSDVRSSVDKVLNMIQSRAEMPIAEKFANTKPYKKRFIVKVGDKIKFTTVENISYFFADGKFVYLVTGTGNRKYILDCTLDELEKLHLNPEDFFRINRKFIVRISSVAEVRRFDNSRLKLTLNQEAENDLIVSRDKVYHFKNWLNL